MADTTRIEQSIEKYKAVREFVRELQMYGYGEYKVFEQLASIKIEDFDTLINDEEARVRRMNNFD